MLEHFLGANSVTICWIKNLPNFLQNLPKGYHPQQLNVNFAVFNNRQKCC